MERSKQGVTTQDFRCENFAKILNFLTEIECYKFSNQIASPLLNSPPVYPIYKNISSNYGKISELDSFGLFGIYLCEV
jgi:hypothetical protein